MPIISGEKINVTLNNHHILHDVSFSIELGEVVAIIGPNGSGKTTLVKAILGLTPFTGKISILDESPSRIGHIASRIGYVPQRLDFDRTMPITVKELMSIHTLHKNEKHAKEALQTLDASHLYHKTIGVLSGGEFQRVLLAMALQNHPEILFLDEPTASIDVDGANEVYELLEDVRKTDKMTIVLVSHDIDVVFKHSDKVLCLNHKIVSAGTPKETMTPALIEKLYGSEHAPFIHTDHNH